MKTTGVSYISVETSSEAEEPVAALLETLFGETATIYSNIEKMYSVVTLYKRAPTAVIKKKKINVATGLRELRAIGLDIGSADITIRTVKREDWSESWKKYFKTIEIGSSLMVKPSWSRQKPKNGQAIVILDPGLSFGTGQHATTSFCLKQIAKHKPKGNAKSLLDIGSGSGILAIAAAKLGYLPVKAFDFDPVAVRVANKNSRINRVQNRVLIKRQDLTKLPVDTRERFNLLCANLTSNLLLSERRKILNRLAPKGTLILAGILASEFSEVQNAYQAEGLKLCETKIEREWQSGSFT